MRDLLIAAGFVLLAGDAAGAERDKPLLGIPVQFHGAGCNLKYTYARSPKADASDCIAAKAGHKEGDAHDNDNFIRIGGTGVSGVEWGCEVKAVTKAAEGELVFAGACSDEGTESAGIVTLLLRPGRMVIVDQEVGGRHMIDVYRLRDDLK